MIPAAHEPTTPDHDDPDLDDPGLDAAAARLHAWHAVERTPPPPGDHPAAPGTADELAVRLRERRSARHVAAAYSAVHGHPLGAADAEAPGRRPRWGLGLRAAVAAGVAVLLVAAGAAVVALGRPGDVVTLGEPGAPAATGEGAAVGSGTVESGTVEADAAEPDSAGDPTPGAVPGTGPADGAATASGAAGGATGTGAVAGAVVVHVVGEVRRPGLVSLPEHARVADAVQRAGGPTKDADTAGLNLARAVVDGEQIRVPAPGEEALPPAAGSPAGAGGEQVVDLNAATAVDLETLPGVGPVLAERIVAWRDEHGPFTGVDELTAISGIGPSVLEQVRDLVRV